MSKFPKLPKSHRNARIAAIKKIIREEIVHSKEKFLVEGGAIRPHNRDSFPMPGVGSRSAEGTMPEPEQGREQDCTESHNGGCIDPPGVVHHFVEEKLREDMPGTGVKAKAMWKAKTAADEAKLARDFAYDQGIDVASDEIRAIAARQPVTSGLSRYNLGLLDTLGTVGSLYGAAEAGLEFGDLARHGMDDLNVPGSENYDYTDWGELGMSTGARDPGGLFGIYARPKDPRGSVAGQYADYVGNRSYDMTQEPTVPGAPTWTPNSPLSDPEDLFGADHPMTQIYGLGGESDAGWALDKGIEAAAHASPRTTGGPVERARQYKHGDFLKTREPGQRQTTSEMGHEGYEDSWDAKIGSWFGLEESQVRLNQMIKEELGKLMMAPDPSSEAATSAQQSDQEDYGVDTTNTLPADVTTRDDKMNIDFGEGGDSGDQKPEPVGTFHPGEGSTADVDIKFSEEPLDVTKAFTDSSGMPSGVESKLLNLTEGEIHRFMTLAFGKSK